jgi:hypothetical protein
MFAAKSLKNAQLYNENFEHFFTEKLLTLTPEQRLSLPKELSFKLFKYGNEGSAEKLTFNEKFYMLQTVFQCDFVITVMDAENGLSIADYTDALKAQKGKMLNGELLSKLRLKSGFALGGKELMQSITYISHVCCTSIYQLVKKHVPAANHKKNQDFVTEKLAFNKTLEFLRNYEGNKKLIAMNYGLSTPEWYALVYFSTNEAFAVDFYNRDYIYSYNSNKANLFKGVQRMHQQGYLIKRKAGNKDKYTISAKGMDLLNRIFNNILLKF